MTNRKLQIKLETIFEYLFVLSIILAADNMYGVMEDFRNAGITSYTFRQISMIVSAMLILVYGLKGKMKFTRAQMKVFFLAVVFLIIYLITTKTRLNSCLEGLCIPFLLFYILNCMEKPERAFVKYLSIYENIVFILAVISLVFYLGGTILEIIPGMPMRYYNNGWWYPGTNYYNLNFINEWQVQTIFGHTVVKNIGIYMEAPGFAFPLTISLWWELFGHQKVNFKHVIILTVTMITTFSAKAYIFGMLVLFLYLYSKASDRMRFWRRVRRSVLLPIAIILSIFVICVLVKKINSSVNGSGSWVIRLSDYRAAFLTWIDHPLWGAGYYNLPAIYSYYPIKRTNGNPTGGILNILAYGGVYMFIGYAGGLLKIFYKARHTEYSYIVKTFLIIFLGFLMTSASQYSYFVLFIVALGWSITKKVYLLKVPPQKSHI